MITPLREHEPSRLNTLPSPPGALAMVLKACSDTSVPLTRLARMVSSEPSLAIELLRVANSGIYGSREVRSAQQAVVLLGARAVRNHAVAHVLRVTSQGMTLLHFDQDAFWQDSLRRATIALILGRHAGCEDPWEAFTVGLIQDAGTVMLVAMYPEFAKEMTEVQSFPGPARVALERNLMGVDHASVMADMASRWGLPDDIADAIRHHHGPQPHHLSRRSARLAQIARIADATSDVMRSPHHADIVNRAHHLLMGLDSRQKLNLEWLIEATEVELPNLAVKHQMRLEERPPVASVVAEAVASMIKITHHYEHVTQEMEELLAERQRLTRMLEVSNNRLRRLATTDELTGASNRRFFMSCLRQALADMHRSTGALSVVMIDLDNFKRINDHYGHATGDDVLLTTVTRLGRALRPSDMVGRLGGEEFALLLPDTSPSEARDLTEACVRALSSQPVRTRGGVDLAVTASFGGASILERTSPDILLAAADAAMYTAKRAGGNQISWDLKVT